MKLQQLDKVQEFADFFNNPEVSVEGDDGGAWLPVFVALQRKIIIAMTENGMTDKQISKLLSITPEQVVAIRPFKVQRKVA